MALDPISAVFDGVTTIVNKIWPDATQAQKDALTLELAQLQATTDLAKGQLAINQEEAKSSSLFVSGARPFFLWVCASIFAYNYVLQPFAIFICVVSGSHFDYNTLPKLDVDVVLAIALPLLGIGGMRTFEKVKGVTK